MWYETSSLNLMVAPRYVGAMVSIRSLSDFDLQADKLAGPRSSEALFMMGFLGYASGITRIVD